MEKNRRFLWVTFTQKISYAVGLEIDSEISEEEANKMLAIESGTIRRGENEILDKYSNDDYSHDWDDYEDVEFRIEGAKIK